MKSNCCCGDGRTCPTHGKPDPTPTSDDCPHCPNQGWYYIGTHGDQEQCEWCWVNPDSKFTKNNV